MAGALSLRSIGVGALLRGGPLSAVGAPAARPAVDAVPDAAGFRGTVGGGGHPGEGAETLREIARQAKGRLSGRAKRYPALKKVRTDRKGRRGAGGLWAKYGKRN